MKQNKKFLTLGLCALILVSVVFAMSVFAADEVTVTGTVYPTALDENNNVTAAVIASSMYEEYVIVTNALGKELFELKYKVVKVSGVIDQDTEGNKTLTVTKYEIIKEESR